MVKGAIFAPLVVPGAESDSVVRVTVGVVRRPGSRATLSAARPTAAAAGAGGIGWLPEKRVANAVGDGEVGADAPSVLTVVFELVVKDIGGDVQGSLRKRRHLAQQEVGEGLFEVGRAVSAS